VDDVQPPKTMPTAALPAALKNARRLVVMVRMRQ
jgi:hypothetical protein